MEAERQLFASQFRALYMRIFEKPAGCAAGGKSSKLWLKYEDSVELSGQNRARRGEMTVSGEH